MIIDENLHKIQYGKEDPQTPKSVRNDIIYKVYLSDRQIWERPEEENEEERRHYGEYTVLSWKINKDSGNFIFGNCTEITTISGKIDWGDGSREEKWRSGHGYYQHFYKKNDTPYNMVLKVNSNDSTRYFKINNYCGKIAQIIDFSKNEGTISNPIKNELVGVRMGSIPFDNDLLGSEYNQEDFIEPDKRPGVLEGCTTLKKLTFSTAKIKKEGEDEGHSIPIIVPRRMCYKTSIGSITIPENVTSIGEKAIVGYTNLSTSDKPIVIWVKGNTIINRDHSLGYYISGHDNTAGEDILSLMNLIFYCLPDSDAEAYITGAGVTSFTNGEGKLQGYRKYVYHTPSNN